MHYGYLWVNYLPLIKYGLANEYEGNYMIVKKKRKLILLNKLQT